MQQQYNQTTDLFLDQPVVYASFWQRFGAAIIDAIVLSVLNVLLVFVFSSIVANLLSLVSGWLYYAIMESGADQATIGKKAVCLKVTNLNGERISFGQATGRYFGKILSGLILLIGYLMMLWDDKNQTLHDKMANTLVVKA
jgi:uncharacterized RDD family membrane protein YckC